MGHVLGPLLHPLEIHVQARAPSRRINRPLSTLTSLQTGVKSCDIMKMNEISKLEYTEFKAKASHLTATTLCNGSYHLPSYSSIADEAWYWPKCVLYIE